MRGRISRSSRPSFSTMPGMLVASFPAVAQAPQKVFRVGHLAAAWPDARRRAAARAPRGAARARLRRGPERRLRGTLCRGQDGAAPRLAAELVRLKMDVIVAQGGWRRWRRSRRPRPFRSSWRPPLGTPWLSGGSRASRVPGGNVTGLTDESVQLSAKRMELLKEAVPKAAVIAVLWNANDQGMTLRYREIEKAARSPPGGGAGARRA